MNVDVEFIGFPELKAFIKQKRISVDFNGDTFSDLINTLDGKYREMFRESILNREGTVDSTVQVIKNNNNWVERDNSSQKLIEGDRIIFMRMMGGG